MKALLSILLGLTSFVASQPTEADLATQLDRFQVIGSHNSYHLEPLETELSFIRLRSQSDADSLAYSHPPLPAQYDSGIRQIELDCYPDPKGGAFANPAALQLARLARKEVTPQADPDGVLKQPGTKVLHIPDFDFRSTTLTLTSALEQTRDWSRQHPEHFPILILLELKGSKKNWSPEGLVALETEILSVFDREHLITPDSVRGQHPNLRTAVLQDGWPTFADARGKIMLALDNTGSVLKNYLAPDPLVTGRLLFPSCPNDQHPSAGWFKRNNAVGDFAEIQKLTAQGFLVRTRADSGLKEGRQNNPARRNKAFASGAQYISTDFPTARPALSPYVVQLPDGQREYFRKPSAAGN